MGAFCNTHSDFQMEKIDIKNNKKISQREGYASKDCWEKETCV